MVAFPVIKLGALLIKQVSKPLANIAKARARHSPFFRNYICMPPAQFYHWCEVKMKMKYMNLGKSTGKIKVPKLNENSAIELGADLMGEAIIFAVASAILIYEYMRQARKETAKEGERLVNRAQIKQDLKSLYLEQAHQKAQILELIRILEEKIPDLDFVAGPMDESSIPEYHRDENTLVAKSNGVVSTVKGWVFSAIDVILPPVENSDDDDQKTLKIAENISKEPVSSSSIDRDCKRKNEESSSVSSVDIKTK